MRQSRRALMMARGVVLGLGSLLVASPIQSTELKVRPSKHQEGSYSVKRTDGTYVSFQLTARGPVETRESAGPGDCVDSDWPRDGYSLIVSRGTVNGPDDLETIPLRVPVTISEMAAVEFGDTVLLAMRGGYECSHHRGESFETNWIIVEIAPKVRLLRLSSLEEGGRVCFPGDVARPRVGLEPRWEIRDGELWFNVRLRSWVCWGRREGRGWYEWRVGEPPVPIDPGLFRGAEGLAGKAQQLGYQPYRHDSFSGSTTALWAEDPFDLGSSRFLGMQDPTGARGVILLPRNGFVGGESWFVESIPLDANGGDQGSRLPNYYREEWPEVAQTSAFNWSENFLAARQNQEIRHLLGEGAAQIFEVEMPCLEDAYTKPNGNESEKWIVWTERIGEEIRMQAFLIETCADHLAILGNSSAVGFPESSVEVGESMVRIRYGDPSFDLKKMERDKFLFDWLETIEKLYPYDEVLLSLDDESEMVLRSEPTTPTAGNGWALLRYPLCNLRVWLRAGEPGVALPNSGYAPPQLLQQPEADPVCSVPGEPVPRCSITGKITEQGRVTDLQAQYCPRDTLEQPKLEMLSFIEDWEFQPATSSSNVPSVGSFRIEVWARQGDGL